MELYTVGNRNMISHIKSDIEEILYGYAFEIADSVTINHMETAINEHLESFRTAGHIYDYGVLSFPAIDNNEPPLFDIAIQTASSLEYINLQCAAVSGTYCNNISKSKQKKLQIELDNELFQM